MFEGVMEGGFRAIIKDTIMMVNKKIRNASIRGRRTALHISKTMMQVNGHGSQVIAVQLRTRVMTGSPAFPAAVSGCGGAAGNAV